MSNFLTSPHKRLNLLTGEWILVSPHRAKRPWQGQTESSNNAVRPDYDPNCYLCPGNKRSGGAINEKYNEPWAFTNDFSALLPNTDQAQSSDSLFVAQSERGICRVICFSPNHSLTIPEMQVSEIVKVIKLWQDEYKTLGSKSFINHVQIFENKGAVMGCSNPHPHGQIWAQESIPNEVYKEETRQKEYFDKNKRPLLLDYLNQELEKNERIVCQNEHFVSLVPYWATWPFETMILPKRHIKSLTELTAEERIAFAAIYQQTTIKYDNLFNTSFPYSAGIHQSPTNGEENKHWQMHMHFYPPLLRSATVKKFMVGYEMLANAQRDITAEQSAQRLSELPNIHYKA
jgi:UDPglucose--hexose-1-phosphate uridylyltransferase